MFLKSIVSASDNTIASAKAIKAYVDNQVGSISTVLTVSDDTSTTDQVTVGTDILNFAGGDGIQTTVSNNTVTIDFTNIDLNA